MPLQPGTKLGSYEVLAPIGAGGMGEVYRAHDAKLDRDVAIKVLPEAFASDSELSRRFQQEGRAVGALNHPNIMAVYDADVDGPIPYVVCELLEGKTLRSLIAEGSITTRKAIEYTKQIAAGLAAAHDKGITHRDVKPDNVFVTEDGRVKILDFGLAKRLPSTSAGSLDSALATREMGAVNTDAGTILGTVGYMAPEQVRGSDADARSDIFSLGTVLYEMLAGRRAFRGDSAVETMNAILKEDPPELTSQEVAPGVELVIRHCLEKRPGERFQSARDLAFHLDSLSTASGVGAVLPETGWIARRQLWPILVGLTVALVGGVLATTGLDEEMPPPSFQQLTFRKGGIPAARFAADGESIVYSAAWDGSHVETFITRPDGPESRRLEHDNADLLDVSSSGEIALLLEPRGNRMFGQQGTLARSSLSGSATREVLEDVADAAWMPSQDELVIVRWEAGGSSRLEFPVGTILHQASGRIASPRVSPNGESIAFIHHPFLGDDGGSVAVSDLDGNVESLSEGWSTIQGLAWTPGGDEIWFAASSTSASRALHAVTLGGEHRVLYAAPTALRLHDISKQGRVLVTRDVQGQEMVALAPGESRARDVSFLDWSIATALSDDGKTLLFNEGGVGGGLEYSVYKRSTDGRTPAVRLSDGLGIGLSADASWAVVVSRGERNQLRLVPTGAGEPKTITTEIVRSLAAFPRADGKSMLVIGGTEEYGLGVFEQPSDGGPPRPITPPSVLEPRAPVLRPRAVIAPERDMVIAAGSDVPWMIYAADGADPRPIDALTTMDIPLYWSKDRRYVYVVESFEPPADIWEVDIDTGQRQLWRQVQPLNPAGVGSLSNIILVAEADAYVAYYLRVLSQLYLVDGLH